MNANLETKVKEGLIGLGRSSQLVTGLRFSREGNQLAAVYFRDNLPGNLVEFGFSTAAIAAASGKSRQAIQEWIAVQAKKYRADRVESGERGKWSGFAVGSERDLTDVLGAWQEFVHGKVTQEFPALVLTRLRKLLIDSGYDLTPVHESEWLRGASSGHGESIWVTAKEGSSDIRIAFPAADMLQQALRIEGITNAPESGLPPDAIGAVIADGNEPAQSVLSRLGELSALANGQMIRAFREALQGTDRSTEVERWVVTRVGQDVFRDGLMRYWQGQCAVTNLAVKELLRASHIKAWSDCDSDSERLDVFNGFLLAPQLDALFDAGWVTFDDTGALLPAATLPESALVSLGITGTMRLRWITTAHRSYLAYHRQYYFEPRNKVVTR